MPEERFGGQNAGKKRAVYVNSGWAVNEIAFSESGVKV